MADNTLRIKPVVNADRPALGRFIASRWGLTVIVHGTVFRPAELPGLVAVRDGRLAGLLTYDIDGDSLEIVTLDAVTPNGGVGSALVTAIADEARRRQVRRLIVITTNDNLDALRFYQRREFRLAAVRPGAVEESRRLKPQINEIGCYDIPIRDEIELVRDLAYGG
ncbi:GNAT family N-acetyltransferase [Kutzneria sp. CA-103260]|uniref:GNAT family N-acetyltransferase n=1 Tax=Kutzneria sp. CA-103260 TaxID=2802641 RepID=UPI0020113133|nr:GNAT family N-acetyltransferase [Kutzneria sp. CA-103260]